MLALSDEVDAGCAIKISGRPYSVPAADLHGVAFRLAGRGPYPREEIPSFVFATLPGDSMPYSRLVEVLPDEQRCSANRAAIRNGTSCLLNPSICLRRYGIEWTNALLGRTSRERPRSGRPAPRNSPFRPQPPRT
jgi:hypothetical protein